MGLRPTALLTLVLLALVACRAAPTGPVRVEMLVTEDGFVPAELKARAGEPVTLVITRKTDNTCATEILVPEYSVSQDLPLEQTVELTFTPTRAGKLVFGCAMGQMIGGTILVR
jgi:plastocyanin domain-containing protein